MKWNKGLLMLLLLTLLAILSACGGKEASSGEQQTTPAGEGEQREEQKAPPKPPEPATLKFMVSTTEENFNRLFKDHPLVKEKLPHITLQFMSINDWDKSLTAGDIPDLVNVTAQTLYKVIDSGVGYDHTEILKANNFDMSRFGQEYLEMVRQMGGGQGLVGIPDKVDYPYESAALLYNKSLFERFAVPLPKDNMTWDEVLELAPRFNRIVDGVQYRGLVNVNLPNVLRSQSGLVYTDRDNKVDLSAPEWTKLVQYVKDIARVQDNWQAAVNSNVNPFIKDQTTAMLAGVVTTAFSNIEEVEGTLDWDMVTLPRIWGSNVVTQPASSGFYAITSTSKNKQAAAELIQVIYESNTALTNIERPVLAKRNLAAIRDKQRAIPLPGRYDSILQPLLNNKMNEMVKENKDVNTVLRELQEEMQKRVDQEKMR